MHAAGAVAQPPLEQALLIHASINTLRDHLFNLDLLKSIQIKDPAKWLKSLIKHVF